MRPLWHFVSASRVLVLPVALITNGCSGRASSNDTRSDQAIIAFDSASVRLVSGRDTVRLSVELAVTPEQKTMGLMERRHLAETAGMLFVYDSTQPPDAGFWMFRTRIPLDVAFLDSAGVVRAIRTMVPCETILAQGCPTYAPGAPYRYALEVNSGYFERHGIGVGTPAMLPNVSRPSSLAAPRSQR